MREGCRRSARGLDRLGRVHEASFGLLPVFLGGSRIGSRNERPGKRKARRAVRETVGGWMQECLCENRLDWMAMARRSDVVGLALMRAGTNIVSQWVHSNCGASCSLAAFQEVN